MGASAPRVFEIVGTSTLVWGKILEIELIYIVQILHWNSFLPSWTNVAYGDSFL